MFRHCLSVWHCRQVGKQGQWSAQDSKRNIGLTQPPPSPSAEFLRQWIGSALVQIMACRLVGASHYRNQIYLIVNWTLRNKLPWYLNQNTKISFTKMHLKISPAKWRPYSPGGDELNKYIVFLMGRWWIGVGVVAGIKMMQARSLLGIDENRPSNIYLETLCIFKNAVRKISPTYNLLD